MDRNLKIGIVGLGLIGGSIFKALSVLHCDLFAVSKSNQTVKKAKNYSPNVSKSLNILKACNIVFVCTPMNKTLNLLDKLDNILSPETIVVDVCSLKDFVCKKKYSFKFIPSHPMAGTEFSGFDNSFETLFLGAKWVITPFKNTSQKDIKVLTDIIHVLGAKPIFTTPKQHDESVALISHMPMIIAQALFAAAQKDKLALTIASSGFRDMTRLATSNIEMADDMVKFNSDNIQNALLKLYSSVGDILGNNYKPQIKNIVKQRQVMYVDGKNIL